MSEETDEPIAFAFDQDASGMVHIITNEYGYKIFLEFLDLYASNVDESFFSDLKH